MHIILLARRNSVQPAADPLELTLDPHGRSVICPSGFGLDGDELLQNQLLALLLRNPCVGARFEQIQRQGPAIENFIMERFDIELRTQFLLGPSA